MEDYLGNLLRGPPLELIHAGPSTVGIHTIDLQVGARLVQHERERSDVTFGHTIQRKVRHKPFRFGDVTADVDESVTYQG